MAWLRCGNGMVWTEGSFDCRGQVVSNEAGRGEVERERKKRKAPDSELEDWSWSSDEEMGKCNRQHGGTSSYSSRSFIDILEKYERGHRSDISVAARLHPAPVSPPAESRPSPLRMAVTNPNGTTSAGTGAPPCYINLLDQGLLSAIFSKIDVEADEVFRSIPFVCRSWRQACQVDTIDLTAYCYRSCDHDVAVRSIAWRCRHQLRRLIVPRLSEDALSYLLGLNQPGLNLLSIFFSPVSDNLFLRHAQHLRHLTDVDLSYCSNVSARGIAALGRCCPLLVRFTRRLWYDPSRHEPLVVDDSEPMAIAAEMRVLEDLVLENSCISGEGVRALVEGCRSLRHIDLMGCFGLWEQGFWKKMLDVTFRGVSTVGFRKRPVLTDYARDYLYPLE